MLIAEGEKRVGAAAGGRRQTGQDHGRRGRATSILKVQQALADSMRMLNENAPNDQVIKLKALEALEKVADGKATKIIIPSEIQGLAGLARQHQGAGGGRQGGVSYGQKEQRFIKVMEDSGFISSNEVLVDTQTGVQYLYHAVGNSGGLTLLVDAEGKPLLYHKTPDAPEF